MPLVPMAFAAVVFLQHAVNAGSSVSSGETGTGFVVASNAHVSYVLTAAHVLGCNTYGSNCAESITARFADRPERPWKAVRVFSGNALDATDLAIVTIDRPNLPVARFGSAKINGTSFVDGIPQSVVTNAAAKGLGLLKARRLSGSVSQTLNDGRLLLSLQSEPGDSGAPVTDAGGRVIAILQGRNDSHHDIAVAGESLDQLIGDVKAAAAKHDGAAFLLERNARKREALVARYYIGFPGTDQLEAAEDEDYIGALTLGSLSAAEEFLRTYQVRRSTYGSFHPSDRALQLARTLAQRAATGGDGTAAYALYRYLRGFLGAVASNPMTDEAKSYLNIAVSAGDPYALLESVGYPFTSLNAPGQANPNLPTIKRAAAKFQPMIAAGDADAAAEYAYIYSMNIAPLEPDFGAHDEKVALNYLRAVQLGDYGSAQFLLINKDNLSDPSIAIHAAEKAADRNWAVARDVADYYAKGNGVPKDPLRALDLYARAYEEEGLQKHLNALAPGVAEAFAQLPHSSSLQNASRSLVFVAGATFNDTTWGAIVYSDDHQAIVAVPSAALACDAYTEHCVPPSFVRVWSLPNRDAFTATIAYPSTTTLEYGVSLLRIETKQKLPSVPLSAKPGPLLFTAWSDGKSGNVGILRGVDEDGHVIRADVPFPLSAPPMIFDLATGALVGFATDPVNISHFTGAAAILEALHELRLN